MAFTPENYLMAERALDQIGTDATAFFKNSDRAIEQIVAAALNLEAIPSAWGTTVTFINAQEAASPGDKDWQNLKTRMDKMAEDFEAMRTLVQAVRDAAIAARG